MEELIIFPPPFSKYNKIELFKIKYLERGGGVEYK